MNVEYHVRVVSRVGFKLLYEETGEAHNPFMLKNQIEEAASEAAKAMANEPEPETAA